MGNRVLILVKLLIDMISSKILKLSKLKNPELRSCFNSK